MITQYQVHAFLAEQIPQLNRNTHSSIISVEMYASINYFTDYTRHALKEHNFDRMQKCFALAENLYLNGDTIVRLMIENSFMYTVSSAMSQSRNDMFMVETILPDALYKVFKNQSKKMINNNFKQNCKN